MEVREIWERRVRGEGSEVKRRGERERGREREDGGRGVCSVKRSMEGEERER